MSNVLDDTTQQQILALDRLGWTPWRIQQTTGVRSETISGYLKAAGIPVRRRGRQANRNQNRQFREVSTDPGPSNHLHQAGGVHGLGRDPASARGSSVPHASR